MALIKYFLLLTLFARPGETVAVLTCSTNTDCSLSTTNGIGDICDTLITVGNPMQCSCADDYSRVGNDCLDNTVDCSAVATKCNNLPFGGTCDSSMNCDCGTGYVVDGSNCKVQPGVPTLAISGAPRAPAAFLVGETYTLTCTAPDNANGLPYTYAIFRGSSNIAPGASHTVNTAASIDAGTYKCTATYDGVDRDSVDTALAVIESTIAAVTCTDNVQCMTSTNVGDECEAISSSVMQCNCNTNYARVGANCQINNIICNSDTDCGTAPLGGTCISNACSDCASGYEKTGIECKVKPGVPTLTLSGAATAYDGSLLVGEDYTLTCTAAAGPGGIPFTYTYMRGSDDLGMGVSVDVSGVDNTDAGTYTCSATYDGVSTVSTASAHTVRDGTIAAVTCTINADCVGNDDVGNLCETISSTVMQCNCATNYARVAGNCQISNIICESDADCGTAPLGGTCVSNACSDCASGYEKTASECKVKPSQPVLSIEGGTAVDSLIAGTDYTLLCTPGSAPPGDIPLTYQFFKGSDELSSGALTSVSQDDDGGVYTCTATYDGVASDASVSATLEVKVQPNKPTLSIQGGTPPGQLSAGGTYTLVCTSTNAPSGTTYSYLMGVTPVTETLTAVSSSNDGSYTCTATNDGIASMASEGITIAVGAAGRYCADTSACSGNGFASPAVCTNNRCVCATNYEASAISCMATGQSCTNNAGCTGTEFTGNCIDETCTCASGFEMSTTGCEAPPAKPTVGLSGGAVESDLSAGATYTLTCTSASQSASAYEFQLNGTPLSSSTLSSVSSSDHAGDYTCQAFTSNGAVSESSDGFTIVVGASGKRCTSNSDCTSGDGFTGNCASNRCVCSSGYQAQRDTCSSGIQTATISMLCILLGFMVTKLL